jgi:hypothetical protein
LIVVSTLWLRQLSAARFLASVCCSERRIAAALKRSIAELGAVGRNLNQIAHAACRGEQFHIPGRDDLRSMLKIAEALRDHFKGLLKANEASWERGA